MRARPFKLYNLREWQRLHQCCEQVMQAWCAHWLLESAVSTLHIVDAAEPDPSSAQARWRTWVEADQPALHMDTATAVWSAFAAASFGRGAQCLEAQRAHDSSLLRALTEAALRDLAARFDTVSAERRTYAMTLREADELAPPAHWRRGDGAIRLNMPLANGSMRVVLEGAFARRFLAPNSRSATASAQLTDPRECLGPRRVVLRAWAGDARISLGELQQLATGDVVRLDLRPDEPFAVTLDGQPATARAYLGSAQGRKALQWISPVDMETSRR